MRGVLVFMAVLGSASAAMAQPRPPEYEQRSQQPTYTPVQPVTIGEYELDGPKTAAALSARLRLLNDPDFQKKLLDQLKSGNLKPDELAKKMKDSGVDEKKLAGLKELFQQKPELLDQLKSLGQNSGGLDPAQFRELFEKLMNSAPGAELPKIEAGKPDLTPPGQLDNIIPKLPEGGGKFDLEGLKNSLESGSFKLPEGSNKALEDLIKGWEKNVGPIGNNPELKKSLESLLGKDGLGGMKFDELAKSLKNSGFDTSSLGKLFEKAPKPNFSNFKVPDAPAKVNLQSFNTPSVPSAPSFGGGMALPSLGGLSLGGGAIVPVLIVLAIVAVAGLLWWFWPQIQKARQGTPSPLLTLPGHYDPRNVTDRASLVKAFELLSVVLCGEAAKVWNHATIGVALRDFMTSDPVGADRLAVLYALARYTPSGEPLAAEHVSEARRTLCRLAGVTEA
jgi:hypothetical protein